MTTHLESGEVRPYAVGVVDDRRGQLQHPRLDGAQHVVAIRSGVGRQPHVWVRGTRHVLLTFCGAKQRCLPIELWTDASGPASGVDGREVDVHQEPFATAGPIDRRHDDGDLRTRAGRVAPALNIPPGTYVADPERSLLSFRAKAFGLVWVRGQMPAVGGSIHVADGRLHGVGEVAASRISTGLRARDWHLRTAHYLHTAQHLRIKMSVNDADIASGRAEFRVVVRGIPASVDLELDSVEVSGGALRLKAHGTVDRSPFGMLPPLFGAARLVHVELNVVAALTR